MKIELMIEHGGEVRMPALLDGISWATERTGVPGKLTFTVLGDPDFSFSEGNVVQLSADGVKLFSGFVFTKQSDKEKQITVTAYDQLRYLQNKDTYIYMNKTASEVVAMIAGDFSLQVGELMKTDFTIPTRAEENTMLFDIIENALALEFQNKGKRFVLYDDFGKLTLRSLDKMKVGLLVDEATGENFSYTSSIDEGTFNKVKLSYEDKKTGGRQVFVEQDGALVTEWGVLQFFDTLKEGENGDQKAKALLAAYKGKTQRLRIRKALGDTRVRAGSVIQVKLGLSDLTVESWMLVEKCVHSFREGEHFMDLTLAGGGFVG